MFLSGIRVEARAGARPGEKDEPQPFVIDLDLEVDVARDAIENTADYRAITDAVRDVVEGGSFDLIESMAGAVAGRVASFPTSHPPPRWCTSRTRRPGSASTVAAAATATGDGAG